MVKVLAPMEVKFSDMEPLMDSIAVRIPTKAMIPIAIIRMVSMLLSRLCLMA
jgi:hypothetical protein